MKKLFFLLPLFSTIVSFTFAQPPYSYTGRTDKAITQLPSQLPSWGGATGMGTRWCDPNFANKCAIRITDRSTGGQSSSWETAGPLSVDDTHIIVQSPGGSRTIQKFDPVTHVISNTKARIMFITAFSTVNPNLLYGVDGTVIKSLTPSQDWSNFATANVFDFRLCLGVNVRVTWRGSFGIPLGDGAFGMAFSDRGGQSTGEYVAVYQTASKTCSVYNTLTGIVTVNGRNIGTVVVPGASVMPRFTIHDCDYTPNPLWMHCMPSLGDGNGGGSGCKSGAGTCNNGSPYFWQVGTTNLVACLKCNTGGHAAFGFNGSFHGFESTYRTYANPEVPKTANGLLPRWHGLDFHSNYADALPPPAPSDTQAFVTSTSAVTKTPIKTYPIWGFDEILIIAPKGSKTVIYRFGQTRNTGMSPYYLGQNAASDISRDGKFAVYTSDQGAGGILGTDNQRNSAVDVFLIPLEGDTSR